MDKNQRKRLLETIDNYTKDLIDHNRSIPFRGEGFDTFDDLKNYVNNHQKQVDDRIEVTTKISCGDGGFLIGEEIIPLPQTWCELYQFSENPNHKHPLAMIFIPPLTEIEKPALINIFASSFDDSFTVVCMTIHTDILVSFIRKIELESGSSVVRTISEIKEDIKNVFNYATNDSPDEIDFGLIDEFEKAIREDEAERIHPSVGSYGDFDDNTPLNRPMKLSSDLKRS